MLYPAIDLKDGECVRLKRGDMAQVTVFNPDPVAQAQTFEAAGCTWLHVVDLNGAFDGKSTNAEAVKNIRKNVKMKMQLGGGIRTMEAIEGWLGLGLDRIILGTVALKNPQLVKDAAKKFPGQIAVGIDAKAGMVAVEGWAEVSDMRATDLAKQFENAGVSAIIYTDIARDGLMGGPNMEETAELAASVKIPVILSGGVSSLMDLAAIKQMGILQGAIVGRALYEGAFSPHEALELLAA